MIESSHGKEQFAPEVREIREAYQALRLTDSLFQLAHTVAASNKYTLASIFTIGGLALLPKGIDMATAALHIQNGIVDNLYDSAVFGATKVAPVAGGIFFGATTRVVTRIENFRTKRRIGEIREQLHSKEDITTSDAAYIFAHVPYAPDSNIAEWVRSPVSETGHHAPIAEVARTIREEEDKKVDPGESRKDRRVKRKIDTAAIARLEEIRQQAQDYQSDPNTINGEIKRNIADIGLGGALALLGAHLIDQKFHSPTITGTVGLLDDVAFFAIPRALQLIRDGIDFLMPRDEE